MADVLGISLDKLRDLMWSSSSEESNRLMVAEKKVEYQLPKDKPKDEISFEDDIPF